MAVFGSGYEAAIHGLHGTQTENGRRLIDKIQAPPRHLSRPGALTPQALSVCESMSSFAPLR
ncbi:hypothetical protein ACIGO9_30145 [Nocardia asteroides]|uniref:hypothetical protein n=1 Tax=Nocardia asteroides TaxID=1824 RepID=UPI0037C5E4E3